MNKRLKQIYRYYREYQWSNIFAMIRNGAQDAERCTETFAGKRVLITGATSGIGKIAAEKFASMGADLLCINRSLEKSERLKETIEKKYGVRCEYLLADLSLLTEMKRVSEQAAVLDGPIDVLIFNAGIYLTKKETTAEGLEKVLAVHYLSYFVMTYLLMDKLRSQEACRIILVNSEGHRFAAWGLHIDDLNWERHRYNGLKSYGSAKLAQLQSMLVFDEKFRDTGVTINAMHPGAVKTETGSENGRIYRWYKEHILDRILRSAEISAEALYYLGASGDLDGVSGKFFNLTTLEEPSPPARDKESADQLYELTLEMCGL